MNKFLSIWKYMCPRCRQGKLFTEPFEIGNPLSMPHSCSVCEQKFEPEPGFYYGAMFISYILTSSLLLPIALFCVFYLGWSANGAMVLIIALGATMFLWVMRYSRSLWIHIMVKYRPGYVKK